MSLLLLWREFPKIFLMYSIRSICKFITNRTFYPSDLQSIRIIITKNSQNEMEIYSISDSNLCFFFLCIYIRDVHRCIYLLVGWDSQFLRPFLQYIGNVHTEMKLSLIVMLHQSHFRV